VLRLCLRLSVPGRSSVGSSNLMMGRPMAHIHHPQSPLSQLGERASERAGRRTITVEADTQYVYVWRVSKGGLRPQ